jgi:hypothetical protein
MDLLEEHGLDEAGFDFLRGQGAAWITEAVDTHASIALFRLTRSSNYPALGQRPVSVVDPNLSGF